MRRTGNLLLSQSSSKTCEESESLSFFSRGLQAKEGYSGELEERRPRAQRVTPINWEREKKAVEQDPLLWSHSRVCPFCDYSYLGGSSNQKEKEESTQQQIVNATQNL